MPRITLSLDAELIHALQELADWEALPELQLAVELVQLALHKALPVREDRHRLATLTEREREICDFLRHGFTRKQISEQLFITPLTVKTHLRSIRIKLGLHTIPEIRKFLEQIPPARSDKMHNKSSNNISNHGDVKP